jgi:ankyrin repeat protein
MTEVAILLVERGADVNAKDTKGVTALMYACSHGMTEVAKLLVERGADINAKNTESNTALTLACEIGLLEVVKLLLDHNAKSKSVLSIACEKGHLDVAKLLVERGADVNAKGKNSMTVLMRACEKGNLSMAKMLVEAGAYINAKTTDGRTALSLAVRFKHTELAAYLRVGVEASSLTHVAKKVCCLPGCVLKISSKCAACNFVGYCGAEHQKAHWKVHKPQCKVIAQILALPAELVDEKFMEGEFKGYTPMCFAAHYGITDLARHLLDTVKTLIAQTFTHAITPSLTHVRTHSPTH